MLDPDRQYFSRLLWTVAEEYRIASEARKRRLDPSELPESRFVWDIADRVEALVKLEGLAGWIRDNSSGVTREALAMRVIDAIVDREFGPLSLERMADYSVRAALAVLTEGVTVAPSEGISQVKIRKSADGSSYLSVYFAGPMRAAAGTESGLVLVYADYVRRRLQLSRYRPIVTSLENEVNRFLEELRIHEREVGRFQMRATDRQIELSIRSLPVEVNGIGTTRVEVVINRDMSRIETNRLRGGALRVLNDGLIGRARKLVPIVSELGIEGWKWLEELERKETWEEVSPESVVYETIAGRPIFSLEDGEGGFRLRYGRAHNTGLSAVGLHPATFAVLGYFLVPGTQMKVDFPGKGVTVLPVESLACPVVSLRDGSLVRVETQERALALANQIERIEFLGDVLVSFGDFLENNQLLKPSPYVPEWWVLEAEQALSRGGSTGSKDPASDKLNQILDGLDVTFNDALTLSKTLGMPLHPKYVFRWSSLSLADLLHLISTIRESAESTDDDGITLPNEEKLVSILRSLLIPFEVRDETLLVAETASDVLSFITSQEKPISKDAIEAAHGDARRFLSWYCDVEFRDTRGTTMAARMGRPEKAAKRAMKPAVHVLFPIGFTGGPSRDLEVASNSRERISAELAYRKCFKCGKSAYYAYCPTCGSETSSLRHCSKCGVTTQNEKCPSCQQSTVPYRRISIDIRTLMANAKSLVHASPKLVKGVRGLLSADKIPERLEKGLLRSLFEVSVFKDGTVRFDVTNAPLTAFRPQDVGLRLTKAQELGYDVSSENERVPLKPQDIIIPSVAGDYLLKVSRFVDTLLERLYDLDTFYGADTRQDLIGTLVVALSPHTSAGIVGRIVGYTDSQVLYANPLWHAQKRRDCDGDQDSIMLLSDVLLNFSPYFLPASMGGTMDAPLMITPILLAAEVDSQAHNVELSSGYPLEFYEAAQSGKPASEAAEYVKWVYDTLNTSNQYGLIPSSFGTALLQLRTNKSSYGRLRTMAEKVKFQVALSKKLSSVDVGTVVKAVLQNHLLPDLIGNLRAFTTQSFRCKRCNARYRRPPLSGKCDICGSTLTQTVHVKTVTKYLGIVRGLVDDYVEDLYIKERLKLLEWELRLTLVSGDEAQKSLSEYL